MQVAEALEAFNPAIAIDTCSKTKNVTSLDIDLTDYDTVIWILGEESTADQTFSTAEQFLVDNFVSNGGDLLVSGSEIGWDLDASGSGASFYNNTLGGDYVSDDAGTYSVNVSSPAPSLKGSASASTTARCSTTSTIPM